jgi:phenylpyruvate tautomerase PptA (4-oxalocrotonate tautomerase family)
MRREVTSIASDYVNPSDWIAGGWSLAEHGPVKPA